MQKNKEIKQEQEELQDLLVVRGVNAKGFGTIAKIPMQDRRLHAYSKCIYSYFCSFAGNGTQAFPSVAKILYDLDLSKSTYYKYLKQLTEAGYIVVTQQKSKTNQFQRNIYYLDPNPSIKSKKEEPCTKLQDTEEPCPKSRYTARCTLKETGFNINILNNKKKKEEEKATNVTVALTNEQLELVALFEDAKDSKASSKEIREIQKLSKENDIELLKYLMQRLTDKNAKMTYIHTVLKDWQNHNLKTVQDVESHLQSINKAKSKSSKARPDSARQPRVIRREPVPSWLSDMNNAPTPISKPAEAVLSDEAKIARMKELQAQFLQNHPCMV